MWNRAGRGAPRIGPVATPPADARRISRSTNGETARGRRKPLLSPGVAPRSPRLRVRPPGRARGGDGPRRRRGGSGTDRWIHRRKYIDRRRIIVRSCVGQTLDQRRTRVDIRCVRHSHLWGVAFRRREQRNAGGSRSRQSRAPLAPSAREGPSGLGETTRTRQRAAGSLFFCLPRPPNTGRHSCSTASGSGWASTASCC